MDFQSDFTQDAIDAGDQCLCGIGDPHAVDQSHYGRWISEPSEDNSALRGTRDAARYFARARWQSGAILRQPRHADTARSAALMPGERCPAPCRVCDDDATAWTIGWTR